MFARFRNLFSKNKNDTEVETGASVGSLDNYEQTSSNATGSCNNPSKFEGLNFLKSIVENEKRSQHNSTVECNSAPTCSLSEEVAELLKKRLSTNEELEIKNKKLQESEQNIDNSEDQNDSKECKEMSISCKYVDEVSNDRLTETIIDFCTEEKPDSTEVFRKEFSLTASNEETRAAQVDNEKKSEEFYLHDTDFSEEKTKLVVAEKEEEISSCHNNKNEIISELKDFTFQDDNNELTFGEALDTAKLNQFDSSNELLLNENVKIPKQEISHKATNSSSKSDRNVMEILESNNINETNKSNDEMHTENKDNRKPNELIKNNNEKPDSSYVSEIKLEAATNASIYQQPYIDLSNLQNNINDFHENSSTFTKSLQLSSNSSVEENDVHSTTQSSLQDFEINLCNNFSIVVEDLPSEITTPSPTVESTISGSSSNTSTLDTSSLNEVLDPSKIVVNPIDNNGLACSAITNKLSDIAVVAESLDAVIRDVQENVQAVEVESDPSPSPKKLGTLRSTSSEDWQSRSTEDDSFATASEGNFTPSSSSYQTASGRTSSYISCDKNSFDANEADDSTYAFEMPELTSPLNMSFEGSEQSYMSALPLNGGLTSQDKQKTSTKLSESSRKSDHTLEEDQSSIADIEELLSENATPTPEENYDGYHVESIVNESETELEVAGIADAPSMEMLTEHTTIAMSRTPEVSPSTSNACLNQNPLTTQLTINLVRGPNDQQDQQNTATNNNNKPNAAWRRSKYYENITKQTIKGFL